ncbi:MAG: hypothetical protein R3D29_07405 [Nitratireductor sp.]
MNQSTSQIDALTQLSIVELPGGPPIRQQCAQPRITTSPVRISRIRRYWLPQLRFLRGIPALAVTFSRLFGNWLFDNWLFCRLLGTLAVTPSRLFRNWLLWCRLFDNRLFCRLLGALAITPSRLFRYRLLRCWLLDYWLLWWRLRTVLPAH